ncbi:MAG: heme-binding protein [Sphingobium sp.]|nr:heme-binding protein [Sphingobium sp.]
MRPVKFASLIPLAFAAPLLGQTPPRGPGPKFDDALALAQAAISACRAKGDHVAALVVDADNVPVVLFADDASVVLAQQFAPRKTALVLRYKAPSAATAEKAKTDAALAAEIKADPKIGFALPGAYPLTAGGEQVGALAVSGGSSPAADDACAQAAVTKASVHKR